jgi:hypothetical protein
MLRGDLDAEATLVLLFTGESDFDWTFGRLFFGRLVLGRLWVRLFGRLFFGRL